MAHRRTDPDSRPVYLRIADELRRAHEPGEQLPSVPKLSEQWGVAKETIRSAIDVLRSEGLVVSWQGRGTFYQARPAHDPEISGELMQRLDEILNRLDDFEKRLTVLERLWK